MTPAMVGGNAARSSAGRGSRAYRYPRFALSQPPDSADE